MVTIKLRFLVGRFHATPWGRHTNEGAVEYPPSSWRLLRSLVAAFYRTRPASITEENLKRILVALATSPPAFRLPPAGVAHTRHYDVANNSLKFFDTFLVTDTDDANDASSAIIWHWNDVELSDEEREALSVLLRGMNTFGRAESWCEAELLSDETEVEPNCQPLVLNSQSAFDAREMRGLEPVRVLAPQARSWDAGELLTALTIETSAMRKAKQLEPSGAAWVTYTRPLNLLNGQGTRGTRMNKPQARVTTIRFALGSNVLPLAQDALLISELARRAILKDRKMMDAPFSEVLTGKAFDKETPLKGHAHAFYLATDEDRDGRLDHLTIYAERGFDKDDIAAIARLRKIFGYGISRDIFTVLLGAGEVTDFTDDAMKNIGNEKRVNILQSSRQWRSVTPFVLPRFATRGAGKPARPRDTAIEQLKREARQRGLPEIIKWKSGDEDETLKGYKAGSRSLARWLEFKTTRLNGSNGYGTAGFEIEFAGEVEAPLALGFGCHFGLGLFEAV